MAPASVCPGPASRLPLPISSLDKVSGSVYTQPILLDDKWRSLTTDDKLGIAGFFVVVLDADTNGEEDGAGPHQNLLVLPQRTDCVTRLGLFDTLRRAIA